MWEVAAVTVRWECVKSKNKVRGDKFCMYCSATINRLTLDLRCGVLESAVQIVFQVFFE